MGAGANVATLNYGEAQIPEADAIELGKKYGERNGFEGFVVVPAWQQLFWKKPVGAMPLVVAPDYGCDSWVLSGSTRAFMDRLERYRPVFHFTPEKKWMNDPNGMFFKDGVYHLYYQYHPHSTDHGPMHWGHATTKDLLHWNHEPVALAPDSLGDIFSGSCVVDEGNTSGFGHGTVVAFFTHHNRESELQSQSVAYSMDNGLTFEKHSGNPVIPGEFDVRDPKVLWDIVGSRWVMVVASSHEKPKNRIRFYCSADTKSWELLSEFGAERDDSKFHGGVWECPELLYFASDKMHVLIISVQDGGPNGGSGTQYFIGKWDGRSFNCHLPPTDGEPLWLDYGPDNYAGVTWHGHGDGTTHRMIGWMSNWKYAGYTPTSSWRSAMTLPRDLRLNETCNGLRLASTFPGEVLRFFAKPGSPGDSKMLVGLFKLIVRDAVTNVRFSSAECDILTVIFDRSRKQISVDRSDCGAPEAYAHKNRTKSARTSVNLTVPWDTTSDEVWIALDRSSIEVFVDGGCTVMTVIFFPKSDLNDVKVNPNNAEWTYFPYPICSSESSST